MKTWHKVAIGSGVVVVLGGIVLFSVNQANKGMVTVQTAKVTKQDSLVSLVTASGEIKPTTYTNIAAQGYGRITQIFVKEGDHVRKGDKLLTQENVQASADVQAQEAASNSAESGVQAAEASYKAAQADLISQQANLEKARLDYDRGQGLYKDGLIPKQDFDPRKTTYDGAGARWRRKHRRDSRESVQRQGNGSGLASCPAQFRPYDHADHHQHTRSERLQGCRDSGKST